MIRNFYSIDYQVHSFRSHDGKASIAEQCSKAVELGLDEIGFTEHKDFDPFDPEVNYFEYDRYMQEIEEARSAWKGKLIIRAGVEIDYQIWFEDKIAEYLQNHSFDFVLGSVHYVNRKMIMTPEYNKTHNQVSAYQSYFLEVLHSVQSGLFDVLSHLEYANRRGIAAWGPYSPEPHRDVLTAIFQELISRDMAFEINTAGLHQNLGVMYPVEQTVQIYASLGGRKITIGSDAHHPDQLAWQFADAAQTALRCGISSLATYQNRICIMKPLKA